MIYHITTQSRWDELVSEDYFSPEMYATEKFIHCCETHQMQGVLERYFNGVNNLLILHIDENKLKEKLLYEAATNGELFPHLYGEINKDAIERVEELV
jgi:uncharacterized protein (DUF952 family)